MTEETASAPKDASRFEVPDGFAVEKMYSSGQSGSVINITFDSQGRLVFSRGGGAIRLIEQISGAIEEEVVIDEVTGNQRMHFVGDELLIVGNGPGGESGLYRVFDENRDGRGDRVVILTRTTSRMLGHGPHALRLGPDGHLYWVPGNFTGIVPTPAPLSPHRNYSEDVLLPSYTDPRGHADSVRAPAELSFGRTYAVGRQKL